MLIDQLNLLYLLLFVCFVLYLKILPAFLVERRTNVLCWNFVLFCCSVIPYHLFPFEFSSFLVKQNIVFKHCSIEVLNLHNILILQKKDSVQVSGYYCKRNIYSEITLAMKNQFKVVSIVSQCPGGYQAILDMVVARKF